jgi:hypothetical protein
MLKYLEFETKQGKQQVAADSILFIEVIDDNNAHIYLKNANNSRLVVIGTGFENGFLKVVQDALFVAATTNWMKPIAEVVFDGPYLGVGIETISLQCTLCKEA